jgi:hypothetical protein
MAEADTPIAAVTRLTSPAVSVELARYRGLTTWKPKLSDFVIWHGWFSRWYGIISGINGNQITVIKENLPKLLFTMPESDRSKNTISLQVDKIKSSRGGEFHILQDGVWHLDE